jgi:hypothetical protein
VNSQLSLLSDLEFTMLRRLRNLEGWTIYGGDRQDIGTVDDFYLDDEHWTVRYLVANIGRWGALQETLVPASAIDRINADESRIVVGLTRGQIEHLPSADTRRPIARRYDREYASQFGYPTFWPSSGPSGTAASPTLAQRAAAIAARVAPADEEEAHLRSVHELTGYHIHALDGESGSLEDFFADETWAIRYFTVHTGHWPAGRTVLLSPDKIQSIEWEHQLIRVDLLQDEIKQSPRYRPSMQIESGIEDCL